MGNTIDYFAQWTEDSKMSKDAQRITETKLQELKNRHPPVGCSFRLGMYFETLHEAKTLDHHEVPDHFSSVCGTEYDDTGVGSMMIYDSVKGDSASAVNLFEVEDILHKKNNKVDHVLPTISEEKHHPLEKSHEKAKDSLKNFSIDSRSNGSSSGNGKDHTETSKSCTSLTSQDSGRDSNGSSQRTRNSHEGLPKKTADKENAHKTGKRSKSREKPPSRPPEDHKRHITQRIVVGSEDHTLVELHDHMQAIKIIGKKSSMGHISDRLHQRYPHVVRSETPMVTYQNTPGPVTIRPTKSNEKISGHERVLIYTPAPSRTKRPHPTTNTHTHLGYF